MLIISSTVYFRALETAFTLHPCSIKLNCILSHFGTLIVYSYKKNIINQLLETLGPRDIVCKKFLCFRA